MRILLISYYFPKDAAIGAVRPYQFARLLPAHGITPWVLTVQPEFAETWDERFTIEGVPPERIIRTKVGTTRRTRLIKKLSQLKNRLGRSSSEAKAAEHESEEQVQPAQSTGWLEATPARRLLLSWLRFPDELAGWYTSALYAAEEAHKEFHFDAIVSTSPPRVAHLIARKLAERHGLRWVMDLRDPWYDEWNPGAPQSKALKAQYRKLFDKCATRADVVVLNTERLREYIIQRTPTLADKTIAIPNGCVLSSSGAPSPGAFPDRFSIGHYGNVYDQRSPEVFLRGLRLWLDTNAEAARTTFVHFVGQEFGNTLEHINALKLESFVTLSPPVPRNQVQDLMRTDYLLLLIANGQPVQIPGKLYEYLSARRRILTTTEHDSATADLLKDAPHCPIAETAAEVAASLQSLWTDYTQRLSPDVDHSKLLDECSYERRTERLAQALKQSVPPAVAGG
jgi:glycosyltransferase involved in cell wall biosynthesis